MGKRNQLEPPHHALGHRPGICAQRSKPCAAAQPEDAVRAAPIPMAGPLPVKASPAPDLDAESERESASSSRAP